MLLCVRTRETCVRCAYTSMCLLARIQMCIYEFRSMDRNCLLEPLKHVFMHVCRMHQHFPSTKHCKCSFMNTDIGCEPVMPTTILKDK